MDKSQIEEKIEKAIDEILTLREQGSCDSFSFKILKTKLGDLVWKWGKLTFGEKISNASIEVTTAISRSINSYNKEDGNYIHYISSTLKNEIEKACKNNDAFEKEIIKIPYEKKKLIKSILKYAEYTNKDINNSEHKKLIAKSFSLEIEELDHLLQWNNQTVPLQETCPMNMEEESEYSYIDNSSNSVNIEYKDIDNDFLIIEDVKNQLIKIEEGFKKEKSKTTNQILSKKYLGALITREVIEKLYSLKIFSNKRINSLLKNYSFFSKEILDLYTKNNNLTLEKTASLFNKDKTDASRKMKEFRKKIEILSTDKKIKHNINL